MPNQSRTYTRTPTPSRPTSRHAGPHRRRADGARQVARDPRRQGALRGYSAPLVVAARLLIARGVDPTRIIEMSHGDAEAWSLRGKLSTVAATVLDGETTRQRRAKNGSPVRQNGRGPQ